MLSLTLFLVALLAGPRAPVVAFQPLQGRGLAWRLGNVRASGGEGGERRRESELRRSLREKSEDLSPRGYAVAPTEREQRELLESVDAALLKRLEEPKSYFELIWAKTLEAVDDVFFPAGDLDTSGVKEKVVVLGSGWGAQAFVSSLNADKYEAVIVSPRNFFLFTPMLAGASVGTVEYRSITQPIREANPAVDYLEATCTDVNPEAKRITCQSVACEGSVCDIQTFDVDYDHLIVSVGATTNSFGVAGVSEHCHFLKQIEDAARIRRNVVNCFERANVPELTDDQRKAILTFVVIGAGPTGVEFCAELCDFLEEDAPKYYPHLMKHVRVKLIEAADKVLMAFDAQLQQEAIQTLTQRNSRLGNSDATDPFLEIRLQAGVNEVQASEIKLSDGSSIPYGLSVWAAGNGPIPLTLDLTNRIPEQESRQQAARGRLVVDPWLRVLGAPGIWAIGDCSFVESSPCVATAQVAAQQGAFLGRMFSRNYDLDSALPRRAGEKFGLVQQLSFGESADVLEPFQFLNLGILAYIGDSKALAQIQLDENVLKSTGTAGFALWRSVYLSKQVSWRNRVLVFIDWLKTRAFGRDMTRI